ncbi:aldose epimerase family protein [Methanomethylophilus alvi]|uniref:aldose epimerase family protein n=1 Tax=Methanomethylophilus alvi TaxID=1291540 RepID=UPI0037DD39E3
MRTSFGKTSEGAEVEMVFLEKGDLSCGILTYGGVLQNLYVPDSSGFDVDVVLGYENVIDYETRSGRMGAIIGRFANRIAEGRFELDGKTYELSRNRGPDHIHGGNKGFDKRIWNIEGSSESSVTLSLQSADGEEGYPGNMDVRVKYTLGDSGLTMDYLAHSDRDTVCNLTNHSYFNLNGHGNGTVEDHHVMINSDRHTVFGGRSLPTGEIASVEGTPLDLRESRAIGTRMRRYGGFDNNYLLDDIMAAKVKGPKTGIEMDVVTDCPAIQFYTANGLKEMEGKDGARYGKWSGLCLETQYCPDSPNHSEFPSAVLRKGDEYRHRTSYIFNLE